VLGCFQKMLRSCGGLAEQSPLILGFSVTKLTTTKGWNWPLPLLHNRTPQGHGFGGNPNSVQPNVPGRRFFVDRLAFRRTPGGLKNRSIRDLGGTTIQLSHLGSGSAPWPQAKGRAGPEGCMLEGWDLAAGQAVLDEFLSRRTSVVLGAPCTTFSR